MHFILAGNTLICFGKEYNNIDIEAQILSAEGDNMCDSDTQKDVSKFLNGNTEINRRQFNKMSAAAGMGMFLPMIANAQDVTESDVKVTTPDGVADVILCTLLREVMQR